MLPMVTRLCSPYKSTALQVCKPSGRHTDGSSSRCVIKYIRKQCVAVVGEKQAASVDESDRRSRSGQGSAGFLKRESEGTQRQLSIQDLRIGCIYKGKVSAIESYGVFVDIGAYTDGFVHISRLGRSFVRRVEDVVQVGQDVNVQIVDLDLYTNSISLLLGPEEGFNESVGLRPLTLSECEVVNRAVATRTNKLARRAGNPLPRRGMSLETRQRLKAYRRAVLAERQAIQLHQARSRARNADDLEGFDEVIQAKC